jgi:GMP synthase (glutamine-hydrolysing)
MPQPAAVAIRHVSFEDLGSFVGPIEKAGYRVSYCDVGLGQLSELDPIEPDLLVVLGGPIGVYEDMKYPFLTRETQLISQRLAADLPTLGICLGAQLLASALGSAVYPAKKKELGWATIDLSEAGRQSVVRHLENTQVLHWHGDTFDLPAQCEHLASTELCRNQAFRRGSNVLGFQFHPEAAARGFERWLIGHACELSAQTDVCELRNDTVKFAPILEARALAVIEEWIGGLGQPETIVDCNARYATGEPGGLLRPLERS